MEKKKNIKLLIIGLLAVVAFSFGISYAYFVSRITKEGEGSNVGGSTATKQDTVVSTTGSIGFTDTNIYPGHKNISKIVVTATGDSHVLYNLVWNGTNTLNTTINYKVYKTPEEETPTITCTKKERGTIRKELYEECTENLTNLGEVIKSGEIKSSGSNTKVKLVKNEEIDATNNGVKVYYYIVLEYPNKEDSQNLDMNGTCTGNINIELLEYRENAATDLIAKNEMIHETFTNDSGELIDTGYRYEGANPKNYVRFNNELWRIIGVFDTLNADTNETESLVKLIKDESIGYVKWDTEGSKGSNDWSNSDIKTILNGQYYNGEDINYMYKNSSYGALSITGKSLNEIGRNMVQNIVWNLGGASSSSLTTSALYIAERGTTGAGANPTLTNWSGYVGLMYPSDFGYAVDSISCSRATSLHSYYHTSCTANNWLYNTSSKSQWLLGAYSYNNYDVFGVCDFGSECNNSTFGLRPSLYLKSNVSIVDNGNDGSIDHPYDLVLS